MKAPPFSCEVCGATDWRRLGRRSYDALNAQQADPSTRLRFRVLFERWFPGAEGIELESLCCTRCGFVLYSPRPEPADIDAKYRFLNDLGASTNPVPFSSPREVRRSRLLHRYLARRLPMDRMHDILDYGGADGRLLQAFLQPGRSCALVDYTPTAIPGVVKLADTLESLPADRTFDLILCSHVIEHVAEPLQIVQRLSRRLRPDGFLYVEVPMEIWRKPPWAREPVTHIQFFTPHSLWNLLAQAGLHPRSVRLSSHLHPSGRWKPCLRALAIPRPPSSPPPPLRPPDIDHFLSPSLLDFLRYHLANPRDLGRSFFKTARKRLARR